MKENPNPLLAVRRSAGLTRAEMGAALDVAENYIYLVESGRKPFGPKLQTRLDAWLSSRPPPATATPATAPPATSQTTCHYPADCNLPVRLSGIEATLATLTVQVNTLTQLLGATLAASAPVAEQRQKAG